MENIQLDSPSSPEQLRMYVDGEWIESESGERYDAKNPATGDEIATIPTGTRDDIRSAIKSAQDVQKDLESMSTFERSELCHELADAIESTSDSLSEWVVIDQGKTISSARSEVEGMIDLFRTAAEDVKRDEPPTFPSKDRNKHFFTLRKPHGVYGVITPWNFPLQIPSEYIAPGLAVGNAIVWCPAPTTSAVAVKLLEAITNTSLPDGAINLVTGEGPIIGNELVVNQNTDAIGFTGSPETGDSIAKDAGAKPTLLELGGNGPVIVLDDANINAAAESTATACFTNSGQVCLASERILVHEDIHDSFVSQLLKMATDITLGNSADASTDMGPLNNHDVADKVDRHVRQAVENGATLLTGGERLEDAPTDLYYKPTVLTDITPEMEVHKEETFGPIAPIIEICDYSEAIEIANNTDFGLSAGVFTNDVNMMYRFAEQIETGIVNINNSSKSWEKHTPVGGYSGKSSGVGRLGGRFTIDEMSQIKNISVHYD